MKSLLIGLLLVAGCCFAQSEPPAFTARLLSVIHEGGIANGRIWSALPPDRRNWWILGQIDAARTILDPKEASKYDPHTLSIPETVAGVDRFYQEPENLPIPIMYALFFVTMKANGEDPDVIAKMIASFRRTIASQPKSEPK